MNFNDFVEDMPEEEEEDRVQPVLAEDIQLGRLGATGSVPQWATSAQLRTA